MQGKSYATTRPVGSVEAICWYRFAEIDRH